MTLTETVRDTRRAAPSFGALVMLSGVAVGAIDRLFTTGVWWAGAVVVAVAAHGLSWLARRLRLGAALTVPSVLAVVVLLAMWFALATSTAGGFPTASTFTSPIDALRAAADGLARQPFPSPMLPGEQLIGLVALGAAAVVADVIAFRLRAAMWAAVPSLAVMCTAVAVARPGAVYAWTIAYVGAVGVFWLTHRFALRAGSLVQFSGGTQVARPITPTGVAFTAMCVVAAVGIAPQLPRDTNTESLGHRTVISPLLQIRALMTRDADVEQFVVQSPAARHWRLTSLDVYDGKLWAGSYTFDRGVGDLKSAWSHPDGETARAAFGMQHLDSPWMPSLYVPTRVAGDADIGWDRRSQSLFAPPRAGSVEYQVDAVVPHFSAADLRSVGPLDYSKQDLERYTQLPDLPEDLFTQMRDVTFRAPTMFDRALLLQDYLRKFTVGDAPVGHGIEDLRSFLFTTHRGTAEQFAAAFAVLARAAHLPTRVVVGFMPGEHRDDGLWHVEGKHAEAWDEVLFGRFGWVPFQPMPGADSPGSVDASSDSTQRQGAPKQPAAADVRQDPNAPPVTQNRPDDPAVPPTTVPPRGHDQRHAGVFGIFVGLGFLLCLLWIVLVPALGALRVRWRRRSARTDADAVLVAFAETVERLADAGCPRRHSETVIEHATRAVRAKHVGQSADDLHALARHTATILYRGGTTQTTASEARAHAARVKRDVSTAVPSWRRVTWHLDPRPSTPVGRTWRPKRAQSAHPHAHRTTDRKDVRRGR